MNGFDAWNRRATRDKNKFVDGSAGSARKNLHFDNFPSRANLQLMLAYWSARRVVVHSRRTS
jgi:hypothetical protein